jgi:hypothetical protein
MADIWKPAEYLIHHGSDAVKVAGYEHRDLGMHLINRVRGKAEWSLTHLGTGLQLCRIKGDVRTAFPIATEIAEAGDWGFISMVGYKDRFPDAANKLAEILGRHTNTKRQWVEQSDEERQAIEPVAQKIAGTR